MNLKDIARPALLVAPDGWVALTTKREDLENWNSGAVKRYSSMGIEVFSADNKAWKIERFDVTKSPTLVERIRSWSMGIPPMSTVEIFLREEHGDPLNRLLRAIHAALEKDCDVLTQFKTQEEIVTGLEGVKSVADAIKKLRRSRVVS